MKNIDKLDDNKVLEIALNMGYNPKKSNELRKYKAQISEMDLWDISKVLFFGRTWEKY